MALGSTRTSASAATPGGDGVLPGVFGGELTLNTFGEFGDRRRPIADKIMHGQLETDDGFTLMASDTPPGMEPQPGRQHHDQPERRRRASCAATGRSCPRGGTVPVPLEKQMWGDEFGMCQDRFGIAWMVNIAGSRQG